MKVRSIQWRAVLLPASVAVAAIFALVGFNFVRIPTTERYLNERNLRQLRTISARIKSKVDNFDQTIDNAIDSLDMRGPGRRAKKQFGEYVSSFAPEIEIVEFLQHDEPSSVDDPVEAQVLKSAGDPPRIMVKRDEGRNFLYLGYRHNGVTVLAKADLEKALADYLAALTDFDALFLVGSQGRVITSHSTTGIELARVDTLRPVTPAGPAAVVTSSSDSRNSDDKPDAHSESLLTTSAVRDVWLGDTVYQMYIQPLQLSLPSATGKRDDIGMPEEWALCGFVAADHFHAVSSTISITWMLWCGAALAAICIAIPLLKLQMLNGRERLRRSDGVMVAATSFLAAAILSFWMLDVYQFGYALPEQTDRRLVLLATQIADRLRNEVSDISRQMDEFDDPDVWAKDLKYDVRAGENNLARYGEKLRDASVGRPKIVLAEQWECNPRWACREEVLSRLSPERIRAMSYPFFEMNVWNDLAGQQRIKWTTSVGVTPFVNIKTVDTPYFASMERASLLPNGSPHKSAGVKVYLSPNTGEKITTFWKTITPSIQGKPKGADLMGQSLVVTNLLSLDRPVLPPNTQFAVVDAGADNEGLVLFHSDPTRSLKENFLLECENSLALRSLFLPATRQRVGGKKSGSLTVLYRARRHQLFVRPVELDQPFDNPEWSLILLQDTTVQETTNLYALILAAGLFTLYTACLALGWVCASLMLGKRRTRWFWPDPRKGNRYRTVTVINGALVLTAIAGIYVLDPAPAVFVTGLAVAAALVASYAIVTWNQVPPAEQPSWKRDFLFARTSLLFVLAVVPALACFHAGYEFETALANERERLQRESARGARDARALKQASLAGICGREYYDQVQPCLNLAAFLDKRNESEAAWDRSSTQSGSATAPVTLETTDLEATDRGLRLRLDSLLTTAQTSILFNDVGADLAAAAATGFKKRENAPSLWWIALVPALLPVLYLLSRFVAHRLLVLTLFREASANLTDRCSELAPSLLLIGPPGSGKSARLRSCAEVRIFDVRTLAYVERRKRVDAVPVERRINIGAPTVPAAATAASVAPIGQTALLQAAHQDPAEWVTRIAGEAPSSGRNAVVGIDHLEHRLDDARFRDQMLCTFEDLLFHQQRKVWVASTCDPIDHLREAATVRHNGNGNGSSSLNGDGTVDLDRWNRVFQSFAKEIVAINDASIPGRLHSLVTAFDERGVAVETRTIIRDECAVTPQLQAIGEDIVRRLPVRSEWTGRDLRREVGYAAEPYYRALWSACSTDEKLALRHLADEGLVNPRAQAVVFELMRKGLVVRAAGFRLMNRTFSRFVARAEPADTIGVWEREGVTMPWTSVRTALVTCVITLGGFLILTEQQLVGTWFGVVPALLPAVVVPAIPTVINLLASRVSKKESVPA